MARIHEKLALKRYLRDLDFVGDDAPMSKTEKAALGVKLLSEMGANTLSLIENKQKADALAQANRNLLLAKAELAKADVTETDKNGPQHKAAQQKVIDAQAARDALADSVLSPSDKPVEAGEEKKSKHNKSSGVPTWVWYAVGGLGAAGVGLIGYNLIKGKR